MTGVNASSIYLFFCESTADWRVQNFTYVDSIHVDLKEQNGRIPFLFITFLFRGTKSKGI